MVVIIHDDEPNKLGRWGFQCGQNKILRLNGYYNPGYRLFVFVVRRGDGSISGGDA